MKALARGGDDSAGEHVARVRGRKLGWIDPRVGVRHMLAQDREQRPGERGRIVFDSAGG